MALDFAGMSALAQVDNWGAIRAEKARELQIIAMRNAMAEKEVQQQAQAGAAIEQYLSTVDNIKVLEQDKKWIDQKNSELTKVIQEGIKKHNGNVKKYLYAGGLNELNKYKNNLLQSEEVATGLTNAYNMNKYMADTAAGLNPRRTSWEQLDPSGAKQVTGTFADNVKAFQEGKATKLNYRGAFQTSTGDPREFFGNRFGNEQKKPQSASPMDVALYWKESAKLQGKSNEDAEQEAYDKAMEYDRLVKAKLIAPYQYKSEDQELKMLEKQKLRAQIGALTPPRRQNFLFDVTTGAIKPDKDPVDLVNLGIRRTEYTTSSDRSIGLSNVLNLPVNKNGTVTPQNVIAKNNFYVGDKRLDLGKLAPENIKSAVPGKVVAVKRLDGKGGISYGMEYQITLNEHGIEQADYGGEPIKNWYGLYERPVPGAQKGGTVWWPNAETLTINAFVPFDLNPQTYSDANRLLNEMTPSELANYRAGYGQSDAMQVYLQMEDRYNRAYQNQQQSNK